MIKEASLECNQFSRRHPCFDLYHPVEDEVSFRFEEGGECHKLPWTELLSVGTEVPFQTFDEISIGMKVMAPWLDDDNSIKHGEATVLSPMADGKVFSIARLLVHVCLGLVVSPIPLNRFLDSYLSVLYKCNSLFMVNTIVHTTKGSVCSFITRPYIQSWYSQEAKETAKTTTKEKTSPRKPKTAACEKSYSKKDKVLLCVCMRVCVCTCMCVLACVCVHVRMCVNEHVCVCYALLVTYNKLKQSKLLASANQIKATLWTDC